MPQHIRVIASEEKGGRPAAWKAWAARVLAVASFFVYALGVISLGQGGHEGRAEYVVEREPMAAAVSNLVYGAPLGSYYSGVFSYLGKAGANKPESLEATLANARVLSPSTLGDLAPRVTDGSVFTFTFFVTASMYAFGVNAAAPTLLFILLMGTSVTIFLCRFFDDRAALITIVTASLTVMLFSPLATTPEVASQIPVGGYRYFSLLAVVPALHVMLELVDFRSRRDLQPLRRVSRISLLSAQLLLLVFVGVTVNSANYLVIMIGSVATVAFVSHGRKPGAAGPYASVLAAIVAISLGWFCLIYYVTPASYKDSGHFSDGFWRRLFVGLGVSPEWPFETLSEKYATCRVHIPRGIRPGVVDQNGDCVWVVYSQYHGISVPQMQAGEYGAGYELAMRDAFFYVLSAYPRQATLTFLYYKPALVVKTMTRLLKFGATRDTPPLLLPAASVLLAGAFLLILPARRLWRTFGLTAATFTLGAMCSCILYIVAWGAEATSAELLLYLTALGLSIVLACCALTVGVIRGGHAGE